MPHGHTFIALSKMNRSKLVRLHFHFFQISFWFFLLCLGVWVLEAGALGYGVVFSFWGWGLKGHFVRRNECIWKGGREMIALGQPRILVQCFHSGLYLMHLRHGRPKHLKCGDVSCNCFLTWNFISLSLCYETDLGSFIVSVPVDLQVNHSYHWVRLYLR